MWTNYVAQTRTSLLPCMDRFPARTNIRRHSYRVHMIYNAAEFFANSKRLTSALEAPGFAEGTSMSLFLMQPSSYGFLSCILTV